MGKRENSTKKKILITGAGSYIGTSFEEYLTKHYPDDFTVDTVDMMDGSWWEKDFSGYDTIFHVAGIAHADTEKVSEKTKQKYYAVNTDLAIETAKKAKAEGVLQFIYMSSIIVYGESAKVGESKVITKDTIPNPGNFYGDSKLKAEEGLNPLSDDAFKVVILRPPMIYGKGSKGNYPKLAEMAKKLPAFPYIKNQRSMLYIENLCEFVKQRIDVRDAGTFFPQNKEYVNTSNLVKLIAKAHGKDIKIVPGVALAIKMAGQFTELANKAFGSLTYDKSMSGEMDAYNVASLGQSVARTEWKGHKTKIYFSRESENDKFRDATISIVTYNDAYDIRALMNSLQESSYFDRVSVYVVDNNSFDGTVDIIDKEYPWVHLYKSKKNLGFGTAHNLVIKHINSKYHFIVNPDIIVQSETIENSVNYLDDNLDIVCMSPKVINIDGTEQYLPKKNPEMKYMIGGMFEQYIPFCNELRSEYTLEKEVITKPVDIEFCSGCFMATRTDALHKLEGFDEKFFLYFEDADLTRRFKAVGRTTYNPTIRVVHKWKRENKTNNKTFWIALKSMCLYMKKWMN